MCPHCQAHRTHQVPSGSWSPRESRKFGPAPASVYPSAFGFLCILWFLLGFVPGHLTKGEIVQLKGHLEEKELCVLSPRTSCIQKTAPSTVGAKVAQLQGSDGGRRWCKELLSSVPQIRPAGHSPRGAQHRLTSCHLTIQSAIR